MLSVDTIFCVTFFSYDYSGYGASAGKPSEKNLYADIEAAWGALRSRYGVSLNLEYLLILIILQIVYYF